MRHFIFTLTFVIASFTVFAQQEIQYTNFMFSQMSFNPGYAGSNDAICATGLVRQQWMGYQGTDGEGGAPKTMFLSLNAAVNPILGGLGLNVISDQIGFETNTTVQLAYAFRLNLGNGKLGIGLQGGFINKRIDFSKFKPIDPNDPLLGGAGGPSALGEQNAMSFDMAFGLHYKIPDKLYVGFSMTQMQGFWGGQAAFPKDNAGNPEFKDHYFIYGGYFYELPMAASITLNPNVLIKTDFTSTQFDINVLAWYNKQIWAGVTYRATDAVAILAGYKVLNTGTGLDGLNAGVSYDITTSAMGRNSSGTFEVFVNYCFKIEFPPTQSGHGTVRHL
jgi:type IX secretion system PorP/SprF family membrane protein